MKTLILGISMFMTGFIGFAILCGSSLATTYTNGSIFFSDIWRMFGITPIVIGFLILGMVGFVIAVIGLIKKENKWVIKNFCEKQKN